VTDWTRLAADQAHHEDEAEEQGELVGRGPAHQQTEDCHVDGANEDHDARVEAADHCREGDAEQDRCERADRAEDAGLRRVEGEFLFEIGEHDPDGEADQHSGRIDRRNQANDDCPAI
jgi:hypothetical protein